MKKNVVDLIRVFLESRGESDNVVWSKILECVRDGVDMFNPFHTMDGLLEDPAIYHAIQVCNPIILQKLLDYADSKGKIIDLSYHRYDTGREANGDPDERFEWNTLQDAMIYGDLSVVKTLCEYAVAHKQDPLSLGKEKIFVGKLKTAQVSVQELMVGSMSVELVNALDLEKYESITERKRLHHKMIPWMTGKDGSITEEFTTDVPLMLKWTCRTEVFEYLLRNNYIDPREATSTSKPFNEWLEIVSRNPKFICRLVNAHSQAMVRELQFTTTTDSETSLPVITAKGKLPNYVGKMPISIQVDIKFNFVNALVQRMIAKEDKEIERRQNLEKIAAEAPIKRHSFDLLKKRVDQNPSNRREIFTSREDISEEVKKSYLTIWKRVHTHIVARELTATKLLNAKPVTKDAQIGKMIQVAFEVAIASIPIGGEFANFLPMLSGMALEYNTSKKAKEQSETVFQATLHANADSSCTNLAEIITAMIVKEYGDNPSNTIAEYIAKEVNSAIDKDLKHFVINTDAELFAFLLAYANKALTNSFTMKQFSEFRIPSTNSSESRNKDINSRSKKSGGCSIS